MIVISSSEVPEELEKGVSKALSDVCYVSDARDYLNAARNQKLSPTDEAALTRVGPKAHARMLVVLDFGSRKLQVTYRDGKNGSVLQEQTLPARGRKPKLTARNGKKLKAVAKNGDVYVVNTGGSSGARASIVKVSGGTAAEFVTDLQVGYPAGISISRDQSTLLVSGQDGAQSVVYTIKIASKAVTSQNMGLMGSADSGGLHRAKNADVFSWAGPTHGVRGTVFRVEFK